MRVGAVAERWGTFESIYCYRCNRVNSFMTCISARLRQLRGAGRLDGYKRLPKSNSVSNAEETRDDGNLPPTVEPGCDYYTLEDVKKGRV